MISPENRHPDFTKNIAELQGEGYRLPQFGELPAHLYMTGGSELTLLVNKNGDIKSVNQATGEIKDVQRTAAPRKAPAPSRL